MAESTMTRAAPGDGEAAGALLATKELVKPEKSTGSIKGIWPAPPRLRSLSGCSRP